MMRKFIYIIFVAALFTTSCEQEQSVVDNGPIELPIHYGYMQFTTDVSTRTKLATDMKGKSFGVIGFEYSKTSSWSAAKSITAPSIFYNQRVNCDATNGVCTYDSENPTADSGDKPKEWGDYRYAFFAYHPYGGAGIELSDEDKKKLRAEAEAEFKAKVLKELEAVEEMERQNVVKAAEAERVEAEKQRKRAEAEERKRKKEEEKAEAKRAKTAGMGCLFDF